VSIIAGPTPAETAGVSGRAASARPADLSTAILDETGAFIHAMPYPAGFYNDPRMPLMYAIRIEGIDL